MAKAGELTIDIKLNIEEEIVAACVAILNMYLKNSINEAFVEREENGDTQIYLKEKEL